MASSELVEIASQALMKRALELGTPDEPEEWFARQYAVALIEAIQPLLSATHYAEAFEIAAKVCETETELNAKAREDRADDELAFEFRGLGKVIANAIRALTHTSEDV